MTYAPATILIIEDDEDIVQVIKETLLDIGYNSVVATDYKIFFHLHFNNINAVILDIMLPYFTGNSILHYIKQNPETKHIPVILSSALDVIKSKSDSLDCDAVLPKPWALPDFISTVTNIVETRRE